MTCFRRDKPCATCPFLMKTKLALWHKSQFEMLKASNANPFGNTFGCHMDVEKEPTDRGPCVGWLLDQKRRYVPSLLLRIELASKPEAAEHFERIGEAGPDLYPTIDAMFEANEKADRKLRREAAKEGATIIGVDKRRAMSVPRARTTARSRKVSTK